MPHPYIAKLQKSIGVLVVSSFAILSVPVQGQSISQADRYYEAQQYYRAAMAYQKVLKADSLHYRAAYQLAESYRNLFSYAKAAKYYAKVAKEASASFPLATYYYAQTLNYQQKYEEALYWYEQFLNNPKEVNTQYIVQAKKEEAGCVQALIAQQSAERQNLLTQLREPINSSFQDFAPAIYLHDSSLLISSTRLADKGEISYRSGEGFSDQYVWQLDSTGWKDLTSEARFRQLNTRWSDASGSFTADKKTYYFTRCGINAKLCKIYVSEWKSGKWQEARPLGDAINLKGSNSKHPAVSASGDTLIFSSDRKGGKGGADLWMSIKNEASGWQAAKNLGSYINTPQDEISPFYYAKDDLLIFASDGWQGMGGMDLYLTKIRAAQEAEPTALAPPFNSSQDDCFLVFGNARGYLASNRLGDFDIYTFTKAADFSWDHLLQGEQKALSKAGSRKSATFEGMITDYSPLLDAEEHNLTVMRSSGQDYLRNGSSRFVLSADVNDILLEQLRDKQSLQQGAAVLTQAVNSEDTLSEDNLLISFSTYQVSNDEQVEISGKVYHRNKNNVPAATLNLYLLDELGSIIKITTSNEDGEFRFVNLEASTSYQIRYADAENDVQEYRIENLRVFGYGDDFTTIHFENIYFDFNQSYLRNEAKVALNQLVEFYEQHPSSVIEINAFTDSTGNDVYNLQLSRNRGQAAFDYLVERGVDRSALVFNAKGVSTAIASSNSLISQQLNRRIEFYVIGKNLTYEPEIVTRMLRPQVTLYTLSNETGMSLEEIKNLNGLNSNDLQAYKPIRIYEWAYEKAPTLFYQMQVRSESER